MATPIMAKESFISTYTENIHRPGSAELLEWLKSTDFFTAPASTKYHSNYEGGLCEHSLNVYSYLRDQYSEHCTSGRLLTPQEEETIAVVALLHDVCKTGFYVTDYKNQKTYDPEKVSKAPKYNVKHDNNGDFIWETIPFYTVNDSHCYGHGECSVDLIRNFIQLSEDEKLAIRWHMGFSDDTFKGGSGTVGKAFEKCSLAVLLHVSDLLSTYISEVKGND